MGQLLGITLIVLFESLILIELFFEDNFSNRTFLMELSSPDSAPGYGIVRLNKPFSPDRRDSAIFHDLPGVLLLEAPTSSLQNFRTLGKPPA